MARAKPISDLGDTDLIEHLAEAREDLFNLRFQFATGQLDNSAALKQAKKNIARLLTELRAREIAAAEAEEAAQAASGEGGRAQGGYRYRGGRSG